MTITIQTTIRSNAPLGISITNQGTIRYDADGNGSNEATAVTDDPGTAAGDDGTGFIVLQGVIAAPLTIPATLPFVNLLLAALLALGAGLAVRRFRT